jgi:nitrogen fixation protein FixH
MSMTSAASDEQLSKRPEMCAVGAPRKVDTRGTRIGGLQDLLRSHLKVREITGRMVFGTLVGFFAVVVGVNAVMIHQAISTFGGLETESSYRAGQLFEREVAMAKVQEAQHWQVEAKVTTARDGNAALDIAARDAAGLPLAGMDASARFERPTDRRLDRPVAITAEAAGRFRGSIKISSGQWDLVIELSRGGERLFRSRNRVVLP